MKILFCGTAAAEGWPALFCTCGACARARQNGGRDIRSRAAYMVGDRVRIDFGPDSYMHQQRYSLAYERLEHLLVTHSHDDHWFPRDIAFRREGFAILPDHPLHIWGNQTVKRCFVADNGADWHRYRLVFHRIMPYEEIPLGDGLSATPVLAAHDKAEQCVNYLLREGPSGGALIAHDTGWYSEATWDFLNGRALDLVALDCTYGPNDADTNHLGCGAVLRARDELARRGAIATGATVVATHFSHNGAWLYEDLQRYFEPNGVTVGYDGLSVEV